jgi:lipopolysaccharide export system protein LptC
MIAEARVFDPRAGAATRPRRGYARAVRTLRYVLPAIALFLIGLVVAWPQLVGNGSGLIAPMLAPGQIIGADVMRMHNPRYVGRTKAAEPFEVRAASAYLDPIQPNRIHLDQLAADIATAGTRQVRLLAVSGLYDRDTENVNLSGGIEVTTSDGYRFETPSALLKLKRGRVVGQEPIAGSGPRGTIAAERFEFRDGGEVLRFNGRVRVTLHPRAEVRS